MWEWSLKHNKVQSKASLLNAYEDLVQENEPPSAKQQETGSFEEMKRLVEKKVSYYDLKDINLIECCYVPYDWVSMCKNFAEYNRMRFAFFRLLGYSNEKECLKLGLSIADINLLKQGITPENYNTHIKIPFDFGGQAEITNLSLMKSHPTHDCFHAVLDFQIEQGYLNNHKKIFIPYFEGKIYYD